MDKVASIFAWTITLPQPGRLVQSNKVSAILVGALVLGLSVACKTPPAKSVSPTVISLTLIDADTAKPIAAFDPLTDGAVLNLSSLPTRNLNIRANTNPPNIDSVLFSFEENHASFFDSGPPYSFPGDSKNGIRYVGTEFELGSHTISATPYDDAKAGTSIRITFEVRDH